MPKQNIRYKKAFTLIELLIVLAIVAILITISTINLSTSKAKTSLNTAITTLVTDIRGQQEKAMIGDTEGTGSTNYYGVYLGTNTYTLFRGATYSSTDPANYVVTLGDQLQFTNVLFSSSQIIFDKLNGEILNFVNGSNTFTIKDSVTNEQKTITVNRYGVITQIN